MSFMKRIWDRQGDIQAIWFDALLHSPETQTMVVTKKETDSDTGEEYDDVVEHGFLRRAFKVQFTPRTGMYELFHTNSSDYYKYPSDAVIDAFLNDGWLQTTDRLQVERDRKRLDVYNKKINSASSKRNDSLMTHWKKRREDLIHNISTIEERMSERSLS